MRAAGPVAKGSKEVPNGQPNCLAGLTFVFTGELSAFSRDEAVELAKRFGGCVLGILTCPSSANEYFAQSRHWFTVGQDILRDRR